MDAVDRAGVNEWVDGVQPLKGYAIHILPLSDLQREKHDYNHQRAVKQERPERREIQNLLSQIINMLRSGVAKTMKTLDI